MLGIEKMLEDVATREKGKADYVIEQKFIDGGNGGYTKWNSGKLEQWGESYIPGSLGNASITVSFPVPFVDAKYRTFVTGHQNFTGYALTENYWGSGNRDATVNGTRISIFKRDANEKFDVHFSWYAIGRWK